jgi:hypothetical protein
MTMKKIRHRPSEFQRLRSPVDERIGTPYPRPNADGRHRGGAANLKPPAGQVSPPNLSHAAPRLADTWLSWQCKMIAGAIGGGLWIETSPGQLSALARYPSNRSTVPEIETIARAAIGEHRAALRSREPIGSIDLNIGDLLACPFDFGGVSAVVGIAMTSRPDHQQRAVIQLLRWGAI